MGGDEGCGNEPDTAASGREKDLIAIAIAASIPCDYCLNFHKTSAEVNGASEQETSEALAIVAGVRHWSTILNGSEIDLEEFKRETDQIIDHVTARRAGGE